MLPAVLLALWSTSAASGAEFTVRVLSTHDVRGTVAARVCQQPCGLGGCGGASKRQAAIASGRMNAADNTTGMLTDLVVIDGGGFFYGAEVQARVAFHAAMLRSYDAYGLNALDFLATDGGRASARSANAAAPTFPALEPAATRLTTAGLAERIEAVGGMPAVLTNYDITDDPFLTRDHVAPYALVPLPHSGETLAVLAVMDQTALKVRAPDIAARFVPARKAVVAALALLAQLPHDEQPAVVVLSVSGWQTPPGIEESGPERSKKAFALVRKLGVEVRGIDAILLHGFHINAQTGGVGVGARAGGDGASNDNTTAEAGSPAAADGGGGGGGGDGSNRNRGNAPVSEAAAEAIVTWAGDTEVLIAGTGPPFGHHFTDTVLHFVKPTGNTSARAAASPPAAATVSNHLNTPGLPWWSSSALELGCDAPDDPAVARELDAQLISVAVERTATVAELGPAFAFIGQGGGAGNNGTNGGACSVAECISGRLVADAMQWFTGADIAFVKSSAVKDNGFVPGVLTEQMLQDVLPDPDTVMRLESVSGAAVRTVVVRSLSNLAEAKRMHQLQHGQGGQGCGRGSTIVESLQASSSLKVEWQLRGGLVPSVISIFIGTEELDLMRLYTVAVAVAISSTDTSTVPTADEVGMLAALWESQNRAATPYITPFSASVSAYLRAASAISDSQPDSAARILGQTAFQPMFVQQPDLQEVQVGLLCENIESSGAVREECDHALHVIDLINDKSATSLFGHLLPNVFIDVEEASIGCSEMRAPTAMAALQEKLPNMLAVIGPPCSSDVSSVAHKDRMLSSTRFNGIVLSGGSTAPALANGDEYPLLARLATNENDVAKSIVRIIAKYGWRTIAVLNDDTIWGTGSYDSFSRAFKEQFGEGAEILNEDSEKHARVVSMETFDADPVGHAATLLASLNEVDASIVLLLVQQRVQRAIFATIARTNPFAGKEYALLTTWISAGSMVNDDGTPNADAMKGSEGLIGISPGSKLLPPADSTQTKYREVWRRSARLEGCAADRYTHSSANITQRNAWVHHSRTGAGMRARKAGYCDSDGPPLPEFSANIGDAVLVFARALRNALKKADASVASLRPPEVFVEIQSLMSFNGITGDGVILKRGSEDLAGKLTVVNRRLCANDQCSAAADSSSSGQAITQRGVDVPVAEYDSGISSGPEGKSPMFFYSLEQMSQLYGTNLSVAMFDGLGCRKDDAGEVCLIEFPGGGIDPPSHVEGQQDQASMLIGTLTTLLAALVLALIGWVWYASKRRQRPHDFTTDLNTILQSEGMSASSVLSTQMPREIKRKCAELVAKVGKGQFGDVFKGYLDESHEHHGVPGYIVAIKTVNNHASAEGSRELIEEAALMAAVGNHRHLVSLIGVVTRNTPLFLIMSFCEHGSLLSQLLARNDGAGALVAAGGEEQLPPKIDVDIAMDIAKGMHHLSECRVVHRDLAARNVLIDSQLHCKVADFGLSRTMEESDYYKSNAGTFALRWTSLEAIVTMKFTTASDVWAYGMVLLELVQDGDHPYNGYPNMEVIAMLHSEVVPSRPPRCPAAMYDLMLRCWSLDPQCRPSFGDIIEACSNDDFAENYTMFRRASAGAAPTPHSPVVGDGADARAGASAGAGEQRHGYMVRSQASDCDLRRSQSIYMAGGGDSSDGDSDSADGDSGGDDGSSDAGAGAGADAGDGLQSSGYMIRTRSSDSAIRLMQSMYVVSSDNGAGDDETNVDNGGGAQPLRVGTVAYTPGSDADAEPVASVYSAPLSAPKVTGSGGFYGVRGGIVGRTSLPHTSGAGGDLRFAPTMGGGGHVDNASMQSDSSSRSNMVLVPAANVADNVDSPTQRDGGFCNETFL